MFSMFWLLIKLWQIKKKTKKTDKTYYIENKIDWVKFAKYGLWLTDWPDGNNFIFWSFMDNIIYNLYHGNCIIIM